MNDRPPLNETETEARRALVAATRSMLSGQLSFFEGAHLVLSLKNKIGGLSDRDEDFNSFVLISSETDHLPLAAQRPLWNPEALAKLEPEFKRTEEWASSFAPKSCENLIARFDHD